jgi:hypothetical protein
MTSIYKPIPHNTVRVSDNHFIVFKIELYWRTTHTHTHHLVSCEVRGSHADGYQDCIHPERKAMWEGNINHTTRRHNPEGLVSSSPKEHILRSKLSSL